jgi:hypothetical protein
MSELLFTSRKYDVQYYYDPVSNKTSWSSFGFDINKQLIERANAFKPPDLTKDPMNINPNYAVKSRKYGYNYFFNTETKTSKWEIPRIPVNRIMRVRLDFDWEQKDSNYDVIMNWLHIYLSDISFNNAVDLPLEIEWVNKSQSTFRVRTNVYDALSPLKLEVFYDLLKNVDDDGNHPIYYNLATKMISLEKPEGEKNIDWVSSLVFLQYDE